MKAKILELIAKANWGKISVVTTIVGGILTTAGTLASSMWANNKAIEEASKTADETVRILWSATSETEPETVSSEE